MRIGWCLVLVATVLSCGVPAREAVKPEKLNFLILLADDLGWTDLGCYGSDLYETPNIDGLAAEGVRFTNGYAACTVCSPTRAAIMTGMYPGRTHVTDFIAGGVRPKAKLRVPEWTMQLDHHHTSLAEAMKAGGYRTAHVGKWHLMPRNEPDVMDDFLPEKHGFDINIGGNEWGAPGSYFHPYSSRTRKVGTLPPGGKEGDYLTDRLTDEALKLLDEFGDDPFFMYFAYYTVHTPIEAKEDDIARFQSKVKQDARHRDATYAAMTASLDRSVGRLRAKLAELGIADNTVIVFTGDNGGLDREGPDGRMGNPTENHPLRAGKGSAYEGGVRTPAIYYWPGVTRAGTISDEPVIAVDIYPTVLDIAGVEGSAEHNAKVDGVSLAPLLRDASASLDRETLFWHYPHYHAGGATPHSAIRDGDWRLVEFYEDSHVELYNLKNDVGEEHDLASENPQKADDLRQKLHAWRAEVQAQDPTPNPDYDPAAE
jgi:arylsulfatase A